MTEERIVPVKAWLRPTTYRALLQQAHRRGLADVGDLLGRVAEQIVAPPALQKRPRASKYTPAELEQRRTARRAAFAANTSDPRHGTHNGYVNLGCRCDPCREASAAYEAARKAR
ncbi:hypothetical protein [Microbacterium sp. 3J1]|uniref:hypothetical protein n=1 Tax=Microbacterium sp. 3J1 TaxID=861269 RepID=UPI000A5ADAFD|nr:hypothetical protein [Microbacterium sp. 3J1]